MSAENFIAACVEEKNFYCSSLLGEFRGTYFIFAAIMSGLAANAGLPSDQDSDEVLLAKAKELQERGKVKARSLEKFEAASDSQKQRRMKGLHNSCAHRLGSSANNIENLQMIISDGVDLDQLYDNPETDTGPCTAIYVGEKIVRVCVLPLSLLFIPLTPRSFPTLNFLASLSGHITAVRCLVQHGANFEIPTEDGNRSLHAAANFGHVEVVQYLLSQGADFTAKNNDGHTPWKLAFELHTDNGRACLALMQAEGAPEEEKEKCVIM